jgi:hypothetical protein
MTTSGSFRDFIFKENAGRLLWIAGLLMLHFVLLKIYYPYAVIFGDSSEYVRAAWHNTELTAWPIGYSKFLGWIHTLIRKDWAIVFFQYLLLEAAVLYFYFSVLYLLRPGKGVSLLILFFLIMNPFILSITNYILSDAIFAALTLIWFTLMIWYLHQPRPALVYLLVFTMFLLFSLRYYAAFYPVISVPVILISKVRWRVKLSGLILGCLLFIGFVRYTKALFEKQSGIRDFSPFSGWQLAANALIMYRHIPHRELDTPPPALRSLHQLVLHEMNDPVSPINGVPDKRLLIYFSWDSRSPLTKYSGMNISIHPVTADLPKWTSVGKLYHDYGVYLIKTHPFEYLRYYVGQGIDWFIDPKAEFTNVYPQGGYEISDVVKDWFGYKSNWLTCSRSSLYSVAHFPGIISILNVLLFIGVIGFFFCRCHLTEDSLTAKVIILFMSYWLGNFLFIIFLAPATLRYSLSIMMLDIVFVPLLFEFIFRSERKKKARQLVI